MIEDPTIANTFTNACIKVYDSTKTKFFKSNDYQKTKPKQKKAVFGPFKMAFPEFGTFLQQMERANFN